jgi:ubiquinone/menaquinone biosynthesis C-methylase UbiE
MTSYVIRGGEEGRARLRVISRTLWPSTLHLLQRAGIKTGMTCLDAGCGSGDVTMELARLVGPAGRVTGIDLDATKIALAQQEAVQVGIQNVKFVTRGVDQLDDAAQYDLVYARLLLTHLRDPADALRRMMKAAKPGGIVAIEDLDHSGIFSYPEFPALTRHIALYNQVVRLRGADPEIGPKLPALLRQVGLHEYEFTHVQPAFDKGEAKHIHQITLENIAPALVAANLSTDADIDALFAELDAFARDPETIVSFPRIFQVWARRP